MGGNEEEQMNIYCAALVHDIGMVAIPDYIVGKKTALSDEEFNELRQHTIIGSKIFKGVTQIPEINQGIRWHHERYDGTGYPDGLSGTDNSSEKRRKLLTLLSLPKRLSSSAMLGALNSFYTFEQYKQAVNAVEKGDE